MQNLEGLDYVSRDFTGRTAFDILAVQLQRSPTLAEDQAFMWILNTLQTRIKEQTKTLTQQMPPAQSQPPQPGPENPVPTNPPANLGDSGNVQLGNTPQQSIDCDDGDDSQNKKDAMLEEKISEKE